MTATWAPKTDPYRTAVSARMPGDNRSDGSYWLYSPHAGRGSISTSAPRYSTGVGRVSVSGRVSEYNPALNAGQLKVTSGKVGLTAALDGKASQDITLTNTGRKPLTVALAEQSRNTAAKAWTAAEDGPWRDLPGYPKAVKDNVVSSYEGSVYSVGGYRKRNHLCGRFRPGPRRQVLVAHRTASGTAHGRRRCLPGRHPVRRRRLPLR